MDVWIGTATDQSRVERLLDESYGTDDPISEFAATQGETFYDHDFIDWKFVPEGGLKNLVVGVSFSESFATELINVAGNRSANIAIFAFEDDFSQPQSAKVDGIELQYVGRFAYDQQARAYGVARLYGTASLSRQDEPGNDRTVDAFGLMIGRGSNPYMPYLDLEAEVPGVSVNQVRIRVIPGEGWEVRDFGENGLTRVSGEAFDGEFVVSNGPIEFSIGSVRFRLVPSGTSG